MGVKMRVSSPRVTMRVEAPSVNMKVGDARLIYLSGEPYDGDYEVTPKIDEATVLPTAQKLLARDVTVKKIPYYEVSNNSGGLTIYIASDEEIQIS